MKKSIPWMILSAIVLHTFGCSKATDIDTLSFYLLTPPSLVSVSPLIGTPAQNNLNSSFPATNVIIKGSNFGIDTVVRFYELVGIISANLGTEIITSVPDGAYSGFITVSKSGGACIAGSKSGLNCSGTEFFVDCYQVAGKQYGDEIEIKQGTSKNFIFSGVSTKAFRTDVIVGSAKITITCDSVVTVRLFDRSCKATDYILQKDPTIPLPGNLSSQFYLTAGSATCGVSI